MRTKCADWVSSFVVEKTLNETFKIKGETAKKTKTTTWPESDKNYTFWQLWISKRDLIKKIFNQK